MKVLYQYFELEQWIRDKTACTQNSLYAKQLYIQSAV